jgi:hypothetical protein
MYKKNDKRRLYSLIDSFLGGEIDSSTFCDEFYYSYDLEITKDMLNNIEYGAFSELNEIASRFSKYESDHRLDPKAFSGEEELMKKIRETKEKLISIWLL